MKKNPTIAALFVDPDGIYAGIPGVELWDETRDARTYNGPHPVVAHPPCARWSRWAAFVEAKHPHLRRGEDHGCFEAALRAVRTWGGVLEHPAYSDAWTAYALPIPDNPIGWQKGICGGWVCYVEQSKYGHPMRKATWLYAHGLRIPPPLRWGMLADKYHDTENSPSWCGYGGSDRRHLPRSHRVKTPPDFRDALLLIATIAGHDLEQENRPLR